MRNLLTNMAKYNIAITRSTKTLSQTNGDVLAWFLIRNGKQSQKEAQRRLNERIEAKLIDKTPTTLKTLTFHAACDEWFESYKRSSGVKMTTINLRKRVIYTFKSDIDEDILVSNVNHTYLQKIVNKWADKYSYSYV